MPACYNKIYLKDKDITVDCGKCLNCISNKRKEYGLRMSQEAKNYKNWYFATLTYDDLHVPITKNNQLSLRKQDATKFIKELKRQVEYVNGEIKYFIAGEYGEITQRPHLHMIALTNGTGIIQKTKDIWKNGNVKIEMAYGYKAIGYTVGYSMKKIKSKNRAGKEQEFHIFSRGIGKKWIDEAIAKHKIDNEHYFIETHNYITRLPAYYKKQFKEHLTGVKIKYLKKNPRTLQKMYGKTYKIAEFKESEQENASYKLIERLNRYRDFIDSINIKDKYETEYWYYKNKYGKTKAEKNTNWLDFCKKNNYDYTKYDKVIRYIIEKRNEILKREAKQKYLMKAKRDIA